MTGILDAYRRVLAGVAAVERVLVVLLLLNIIVNIGTQVFSRYVLGNPLVWVEELATYSFIWATFLGASLGLKHGRHVKIESFVGRLPPAGQAVLRLLVWIAVLAVCLTLMRAGWTVMGIEGRRTSISLPIELPISLFFSVPLFVGMASMTATLVYLIAAEIKALAGATPLAPILAPAGADAKHYDDV